MPKVSIVIPTHNRPLLLARAIRSVLSQTFSDYEVIVVDDGDKPRVRDIVDALNDDRFRYIAHHPANQGGSATRNTGIKESHGEYVAFLDDDDEWLSEKLALQVEAIKGVDQEVGFVATGVENVTEHGSTYNQTKNGTHDFSVIVLLRFKGFITSSLLIRRSVFDSVGFFDESLPSHQEVDLLIRITQVYKGVGIDLPLVRMDMTPHEHIGGDLLRRIRGRELLLAKHAGVYAKHKKAFAKQYFWLAIWCRDSGDRVKARTYFWKAFMLTWNPRYLAHACLAVF
ncbi:MAG: hypothetical protein A2942_00275 [Candidatus Lloydbacteria bacterium RIFCSPLOWO2_01_FULL_50_20]|uniref:Glycosyltransferase 2-like domain-containing protein n=1 Tax=Candidatus Lloydbacteria bacterium RIFCSPLOWO2_01_FULL_50_20 TaxID=1798665 RepID=A0A1G2DFV4_9BACT|nr:MAG: hypothetical protein A3C13_04620 [Candidatus Lloydbacteria bacterium RIFCSPHIGHO2_02_FULL_50_11]OGZ12534.1 MAG: hypothetical protein A2942_00275 [Candidatus Lloydbacteria bacterium RIFCSPLOWO2_01_FULL_50_20]